MNSTERIAAIRADYAKREVDVASLSDVELLIRSLDWADSEINRLNRRDEDRRADERARERAIRTAARRQNEDEFRRWDALVFQSLRQLTGETVRSALYRAANLPGLSDRDGLVADMREAAAKALHLWESETRDLAEGAGRYEQVNVARQQLREIARLRRLITEHAVRLSDHARPKGTDRICECRGCELIRAMDDVEIPEVSVGDAA